MVCNQTLKNNFYYNLEIKHKPFKTKDAMLMKHMDIYYSQRLVSTSGLKLCYAQICIYAKQTADGLV